jgi:hypothetical protein
MTYEIDNHKLESLLGKAAEMGASKVLQELGLKKSDVSQREAFRRFGEGRIRKWRAEGKVTPVKIGGKIYYNLQKLELLKTTNDLFL